MKSKSQIIALIKKERLRKGLSQSDIAKKIGIIQQAYSHYESGRNEMTLSTLLEICDILEINLFDPETESKK